MGGVGGGGGGSCVHLVLAKSVLCKQLLSCTDDDASVVADAAIVFMTK